MCGFGGPKVEILIGQMNWKEHRSRKKKIEALAMTHQSAVAHESDEITVAS